MEDMHHLGVTFVMIDPLHYSPELGFSRVKDLMECLYMLSEFYVMVLSL